MNASMMLLYRPQYLGHQIEAYAVLATA